MLTKRDPHLPFSSARAALAALDRREISAVELTESALKRIELLNPRINAFREVIAERALSDARQVDDRRTRSEPLGPLAGLPIGIKEIVDTIPAACSAGLTFRSNERPRRDAAVTTALRDAGAVVVGVTVSDPGAFGVRTAEVVHPQRPELSVGGSSGGSAAALGAELCYGTIGTDTGGSIRIPSACCATSGLKPTRGRVSKRGVLPLAWSLDHIGPMTSRTADLEPFAAILDAVGFHRNPAPRKQAVGYDPAYYADADDEVQQHFEALLDTCRSMGLSVVKQRLPHPDEALPVHGTIFSAESAAFHLDAFAAHESKYPPLAQEVFLHARTLNAVDYVRACRLRQAFTRQVDALFDEVDFVLTPTLPLWQVNKTAEGFMIGETWRAFTSALIRFTALFDHTGHPVVAMPMGLFGPGVASSVQVVAPRDADAAAVRFAVELEAALDLKLDRTVLAETPCRSELPLPPNRA